LADAAADRPGILVVDTRLQGRLVTSWPPCSRSADRRPLRLGCQRTPF